MTDSLIALFLELREQRPPIWDCDGRLAWFEAIGQVLASMPTARRWACMIVVAGDLSTSMPGLPHELAFVVVEQAVNRAAVIHADRR